MPEITDEEMAELDDRAQLAGQDQLVTASQAADPDTGGEDPEGPATLTAAEVREFRRLQKAAADQANKDREARRVAELKRSGPTHWVHLADGKVLMMSGGNIGTHHRLFAGEDDTEGYLVKVAGAFEMAPAERDRENAKRLAAL